MRRRRLELFCATAIFGGAWIAFACSGGEDYPSSTTGGSATAQTGGTATSTGGIGGSGGAGTATYSQVLTFITSQCAPCHDSAEMPTLNPAQPASLYTTLTTRAVTQCGGNKMVTPNDPSKSALLMVGTDKCPGLKMPSGCTETLCFSANDIAMLTAWIQSGAKGP